MRAPPGSQTQGEVHLTDNPADLDVITACGNARRHPSVQRKNPEKSKHTQQAAVREKTASDEPVCVWGGGTSWPF